MSKLCLQNKKSRVGSCAPLFWLVFALILPGVMGAIALFFHEYREAREKIQTDALQSAQIMVHLVSVQLAKAQLAAQTLATSDSLARRDFAEFQHRARTLLERNDTGMNVTLTDKSGYEVVNTLRLFGETLPRHGDQEKFFRVFATGQAMISSGHPGSVTGLPEAAIHVPVFSDGEVAYILSVAFIPRQLASILPDWRLPPDWMVTVFDHKELMAPYGPSAGRRRVPDYVRQLLEKSEGTFQVTLQENVPTLIAYSRAPLSNWSVAIGIPCQSLNAKLMHSVELLGLSAASVLFGVYVALAWFLGGKIAE